MILVALISGGGVYAWQANKAVSEKTELQSQITSLQSQLSQKTTPTTTTSTTTTPTTPTPKDETADWKTYTNEQYGFQITLTDAFKNYKTRTTTANDGSKMIYFGIPVSDKTYNPSNPGYDERFSINIYNLSDWKKKQSIVEPQPTLINQNSSYVYTYFMAQDLGLSGINFPEIKNILSTFKFTK